MTAPIAAWQVGSGEGRAKPRILRGIFSDAVVVQNSPYTSLDITAERVSDVRVASITLASTMAQSMGNAPINRSVKPHAKSFPISADGSLNYVCSRSNPPHASGSSMHLYSNTRSNFLQNVSQLYATGLLRYWT